MTRTRKKQLIEIPDLTQDQYSHWKLAVDECAQNLKPDLEKLGFTVLSFDGLLDGEEVHELLLESKVDFFVTTRGRKFMRYLTSVPFGTYIFCGLVNIY